MKFLNINKSFDRDPFDIYGRLYRMFVKRKKISEWSFVPYSVKTSPVEFHFWIWLTTSIPKDFWRFNNLISFNIDRIKSSIRQYDTRTMWLGMHGKKKIKLARLDQSLDSALRNNGKIYYVPTYDEICDEYVDWDKKYKYKYGKISSQKLNVDKII